MRKFNAECIVLKSINYKDQDKLLTLFSKNYGKFVVLAKGIRKISSRRAGMLDTLNHLVVGISESAAGYKTLTETKSLNSFRNLKKNLEVVSNGYYVAELIHKSMEEGHEFDPAFDLVLKTLNLLDIKAGFADASLTYTVSKYEYELMNMLGYKMTVEKCANCGKGFAATDENWNTCGFSHQLGGLVCANCVSFGYKINNQQAFLLNSLSKFNFDERQIVEGLEDLNGLMKHYVEDKLGERIRSTRVFSTV